VGWASYERASFDNFVRLCKQRLRYGQAQRLGGTKVDSELRCRRLPNGQLGRSGATENLRGLYPEFAIRCKEICAVTNEPACFNKAAHRINCRQPVTRRESGSARLAAGVYFFRIECATGRARGRLVVSD